MWAYALIAIGLINWGYQSAQPNVAMQSLLVILPGVVLLTFTFIGVGQGFLRRQWVSYLWIAIGIACLIVAFTN
jgi:hypothetical protein